jgi:hypothetical protein
VRWLDKYREWINRRACHVCNLPGDRRKMHSILHGMGPESDCWIEYIHDHCLDRNRKLGLLTEHYLGIGGR